METQKTIEAAVKAAQNKKAAIEAAWAVVAPFGRYCCGDCERCAADRAAIEAAVAKRFRRAT